MLDQIRIVATCTVVFAYDALSCRSLSVKEPLIIGLFYRNRALWWNCTVKDLYARWDTYRCDPTRSSQICIVATLEDCGGSNTNQSQLVRLQCVAVCCSVLQCVAVCCSVLLGVAVCQSQRMIFGEYVDGYKSRLECSIVPLKSPMSVKEPYN